MSIKAKDFYTKYVDQGKPVILYGKGLIKGDAKDLWKRKDLVETYGSLDIIASVTGS